MYMHFYATFFSCSKDGRFFEKLKDFILQINKHVVFENYVVIFARIKKSNLKIQKKSD